MLSPEERPLIERIGAALQDLEVVADLLVAIGERPEPLRVKPLVLLALTRLEHAILTLNLDQRGDIPPRWKV